MLGFIDLVTADLAELDHSAVLAESFTADVVSAVTRLVGYKPDLEVGYWVRRVCGARLVGAAGRAQLDLEAAALPADWSEVSGYGGHKFRICRTSARLAESSLFDRPEDSVRLFHGTSLWGARSIRRNGIRFENCEVSLDWGHQAFYVSSDFGYCLDWAMNFTRPAEIAAILVYDIPKRTWDDVLAKKQYSRQDYILEKSPYGLEAYDVVCTSNDQYALLATSRRGKEVFNASLSQIFYVSNTL